MVQITQLVSFVLLSASVAFGAPAANADDAVAYFHTETDFKGEYEGVSQLDQCVGLTKVGGHVNSAYPEEGFGCVLYDKSGCTGETVTVEAPVANLGDEEFYFPNGTVSVNCYHI